MNLHRGGLYSPSYLDSFCRRAVDQELSFEEISDLCKKRSSVLEQWVPESMDEVTRRAGYYDQCVELVDWFNRRPND